MTNLKRTVFVLSFLLVSCELLAPDWRPLPVLYSSPVEPYRRLLYAVGMAETGGDTLAYNTVEQAAGIFQIRPIRLEDYNNRTGCLYTMKDLFTYKVSEEIFLYYATRIGPYDFEKIARSWNGSGRKTAYYWNRVKKFL
jgi:hypothetical protein